MSARLDQLVRFLGSTLGKDASLGIARKLAASSRRLATAAHRLVFRLQWQLPPEPEWQDHHTTVHLLWPEMRQPYWAERGCMSTFALAQGCRILSICCGDGFYDRFFYSGRAETILALDFDSSVIAFAQTYNGAPNIIYKVHDIRDGLPGSDYDNIVWNGAIEHFTPIEIDKIMLDVKRCLKKHGVVSGYTIAAVSGIEKQLSHHEYEFVSKEDLLRFFTPFFENVKVVETRWPAVGQDGSAIRHNLYFYASDGVLPFDENWQAQASISKLAQT